MVDIPALRKVVDHALALPKYEADGEYLDERAIWDQDDWLSVSPPGECYHRPYGCTISERGVVTSTGKKCGTSGCIAGWTALLLAPDGTKVDGCCLTLPGGEKTDIESWARERLDLAWEDAGELFSATNEARDIERITNAIIAEAEGAS